MITTNENASRRISSSRSTRGSVIIACHTLYQTRDQGQTFVLTDFDMYLDDGSYPNVERLLAVVAVDGGAGGGGAEKTIKEQQ